MRLILLGPPGAGKGTQGKILGQIPNLIHFSCGDAFRNLRVDSPLGRIFVDYASTGRLVPDEPTIELWKSSIEGWIATGKFRPEADTLVLDGILAGKLNKTVAWELELSVKTVEAYRASIMAKMEAGSVAELARMVASVEG